MGVKVDFKVNVPHGEMDITENGQYDVSDYAIANVNVAFETEEKSVTITENGTQEVLPSVGKDALNKVVINTEIPIKEEQSKNVEIKQNGTISVLPDEGKVLNEVSITTNVPQDNTLKNLLDATKSCYYLFNEYNGTSVDDLIQPNDTANVTNMSSMFYNCANLTTIPQLNTGKATSMNSMFCNCNSLTAVPLYNTSKVTNMSQMFWHCGSLQTIPAYDCTNVTNMNNIFASCSSLKSILMTNIGVSLNISSSTLFERSDLLVILNNLQTVTSTKVLTMGATNLAKLTDEDKLIATNKGWTLA